jgi:hypothetical protein
MVNHEIRMKFWCDVYAAVVGQENAVTAANTADRALEEFDERFSISATGVPRIASGPESR